MKQRTSRPMFFSGERAKVTNEAGVEFVGLVVDIRESDVYVRLQGSEDVLICSTACNRIESIYY